MSLWKSSSITLTAAIFYFIIGEIIMRISPLRENNLGYRILTAEFIFIILTFLLSFIYFIYICD